MWLIRHTHAESPALALHNLQYFGLHATATISAILGNHMQELIESEYLYAFGQRLRSLRIKRCITRVHLAKAVGLSVYRLDQIEAGKFDTDFLTVFEILQALNFSSSALLEDLSASCQIAKITCD